MSFKPTIGTPQLTTDELTVIVASLSCLIFFLVIMVLLCVLYRRDPLCCKAREYHDSHTDLATPPQYYSSTQTLVGPTCSSQVRGIENTHRQSDSLFLIGLPSSYGLPSLAVPRLPSYESVRKKDRQRQIHMMIADRFGLNGPYISEPPPSYEESIRESVEIPCGAIGPLHESSDTIGSSEVSCGVIGPSHEFSNTIGPSDVPCGVIGPLHEPSDTIGSPEVSCGIISASHEPNNTIGLLEVSCDMIGRSSPPCDVISDNRCDMIGHLQAPCDVIGPLTASSYIIGPLNTPSQGTGPAGNLSAAINVSDLPQTHTDSPISPV